MSGNFGNGFLIPPVAQDPQFFADKLRAKGDATRTRMRRTAARSAVDQIFTLFDDLLILDHLAFRKNNHRMAVGKQGMIKILSRFGSAVETAPPRSIISPSLPDKKGVIRQRNRIFFDMLLDDVRHDDGFHAGKVIDHVKHGLIRHTLHSMQADIRAGRFENHIKRHHNTSNHGIGNIHTLC